MSDLRKELEALVERWRKQSSGMTIKGTVHPQHFYDSCADELRALLDAQPVEMSTQERAEAFEVWWVKLGYGDGRSNFDTELLKAVARAAWTYGSFFPEADPHNVRHRLAVATKCDKRTVSDETAALEAIKRHLAQQPSPASDGASFQMNAEWLKQMASDEEQHYVAIGKPPASDGELIERLAKALYDDDNEPRKMMGRPKAEWSKTDQVEKDAWLDRVAKLLPHITAHYAEREAAQAKWECKALRAGTPDDNYPQDCDFPFCGCDPGAEKVMTALVDCGWLSRDEAAAQAEAVREECANLVAKIFHGDEEDVEAIAHVVDAIRKLPTTGALERLNAVKPNVPLLQPQSASQNWRPRARKAE